MSINAEYRYGLTGFSPESLEGKISATTDALSHFHNGFYLKILYSWSKKINPSHYRELIKEGCLSNGSGLAKSD